MTKSQKREAYKVWMADLLERLDTSVTNMQNSLENNDWDSALYDSKRITDVLKSLKDTQSKLDSLST